jgi:hypothetical protein
MTDEEEQVTEINEPTPENRKAFLAAAADEAASVPSADDLALLETDHQFQQLVARVTDEEQMEDPEGPWHD